MKTVKRGPDDWKGSPVVYYGTKTMVENTCRKGEFLV